MQNLKFAYKNILHARLRSGIFILMFGLLFAVLLFSLCLYRNARREMDSLEQAYGGTLNIVRAQPVGASPADMHNPPLLRLEECLALREYEQVASVEVLSFNYCGRNTDSSLFRNGVETTWGAYFFVIGYNMAEENSFTRAQEGGYVEGRCFAAPGECVISQSLAKRRALLLGDSLEVRHDGSGASISLEIVGIIKTSALEARYTDNSNNGSYIFTAMEQVAEAFIDVGRPMFRFTYAGAYDYYDGYNCIIKLKSYKDRRDFQALLQLTRKDIGGYTYGYFVYPAMAEYYSLLEPLQQARAQFYRLTRLLAGLFLLSLGLISLLNARARRGQFAVLCSMGMGRRAIFGGFCLEQLLLYLGSLLLGGCLGLGLLGAAAGGLMGDLELGWSAGLLWDALYTGALGLCASILIAGLALACILAFKPLKLLRN